MIIWKRSTATYSNAYDGYIGKWQCFTLHWNSTKAKGSDEPDWILNTNLPGLKSNLGKYSEEDGKIRADKVADYWVKNTPLNFKGHGVEKFVKD